MIKAIKLVKIRNKESKFLNQEENALFEEIVNKIYESPLSFYEKERNNTTGYFRYAC